MLKLFIIIFLLVSVVSQGGLQFIVGLTYLTSCMENSNIGSVKCLKKSHNYIKKIF